MDNLGLFLKLLTRSQYVVVMMDRYQKPVGAVLTSGTPVIALCICSWTSGKIRMKSLRGC